MTTVIAVGWIGVGSVIFVAAAVVFALAWAGCAIATVIAAARYVDSREREERNRLARLVMTDLISIEAFLLATGLVAIVAFELFGDPFDALRDPGEDGTRVNVSIAVAAFVFLVVLTIGLVAMWAQRLPYRDQLVGVALVAFVCVNAYFILGVV